MAHFSAGDDDEDNVHGVGKGLDMSHNVPMQMDE
jgi:hypothetical protein